MRTHVIYILIILVLLIIVTLPKEENPKNIESLATKLNQQNQFGNIESRFEYKEAVAAFEFILNLDHAHDRLYETFMLKSNLGDYDTSTSSNPYEVLNNKENLPEDAEIILTVSKKEFLALDMPGWETFVIRGSNTYSYLKVWMAYKMAEVASLKLQLLNTQKNPDPEALDRLEEEYSKFENTIVTYLITPPVD